MALLHMMCTRSKGVNSSLAEEEIIQSLKSSRELVLPGLFASSCVPQGIVMQML